MRDLNAGGDLLIQHMLKLKLDAVAQVAAMALASCKESSSLLFVFGFNTPLLGPCDEHHCVEHFELGLSFECRNSHRSYLGPNHFDRILLAMPVRTNQQRSAVSSEHEGLDFVERCVPHLE
jgi:hypothetical protein